MSFSLNFPLFLVVLSLLCAVVSSVLKGRAARVLSLTLFTISAAANFILFLYTHSTGQNYIYMMGHYPHPWGNELRIGILESLVSTCFSTVLLLTVYGGIHSILLRVAEGKRHFFYCFADLIQAALLVLVYSNDIFTAYVFIEICTISSCGILMIRESGESILASVRYMIFSLIGSGLFLFGVIFLYGITGHLLMPNLYEKVAALYESGEYRLPLLTSMTLITTGLAIKSGLFPFHLWMPDTYGASLPASSGILSGLISKGYIFLLIRIIFDVFGAEVFYSSGIQNVVFVLGALGIVMGSLSAIRENDIMRMTAYSSAAQIGYIYMGIGLSARIGIEAALFQILAHAFTKPVIFLASGRLSNAMGGAKKFHNIEGAGFINIPAGAAFTFGAFSMIGLPLTMGFIVKYLFGRAAFDSTQVKMIPTLIVLAISTMLNTLYFARTVIRIYTHTPAIAGMEKIKLRLQVPFVISAAAFVLINMGFGIMSRPVIELLAEAIRLF